MSIEFELRVTASRVYDGRAIVGFAGIETMNDAESLRGVELRVPDAALQKMTRALRDQFELGNLRPGLGKGDRQAADLARRHPGLGRM